MDFRVGNGYDVHQLAEGLPLVLGGVRIPHTKGCVAHSDGDVLIHALIDALFGAAGEADIGAHFPPSDDRYLNIDSCILLAETRDILNARGFRIEYADMTIVAQKPKLAAYLPVMREKIASVLEIPPERLNVKATTEEKMGFTGREEGIAAHAVCLLSE